MTPAIVIVLAAVIVWAVIQAAHKARKGGGCCGEHEAAPGRVKAADRNKAHYPYEAVMDIGGMTCENCARRVENALNQLDGVWATVSISTHQAKVLLKRAPDEHQLRQAVHEAGYVVTRFSARQPHQS